MKVHVLWALALVLVWCPLPTAPRSSPSVRRARKELRAQKDIAAAAVDVRLTAAENMAKPSGPIDRNWDELSSEERTAAQTVGYGEASWGTYSKFGTLRSFGWNFNLVRPSPFSCLTLGTWRNSPPCASLGFLMVVHLPD